MKKNNLRDLLTTFLLTLSVSACNGGQATSESSKDPLVVWTFTDELKELIDNYYIPNCNPDYEIDVKVYALDDLSTKLRQAISTNKNLPDLVALEAKVVLNYIDSGVLINLNDIVSTGKTDNMYDYTKDIVTVDGNCYALSWQATPGGFFYRTDLAETHLGVKTPEEMQAKMSDWSKFIATSGELKEKGVKMLSSTIDPVKVFLGQRETGWVDSQNNFVVDDSLLQYNPETQEFGTYNCFDVVKSIHENYYSNRTAERSTTWYSDMSGDTVFGYFMSAWGLAYDLKDNSTKAGDWGFIEGPGNFYSGGTWLSGLNTSKKVNEVKDIISYFTTNTDFLRNRALTSGDFMNNKVIMNEIKNNPSEESLAFLGGQNHYEIMYDIAEKINGNLFTKYDSIIDGYFESIVGDYAQSKSYARTIQAAVTKFENTVKDKYSKVMTITPKFPAE